GGATKELLQKISRNLTQIREIIFVSFFLFIASDHFCYNLSLNGVQKLASTIISPTQRKT
ncbi:TPA: hypothetical protein ACG85K_000755, partial [Enterococcus faecium]